MDAIRSKRRTSLDFSPRRHCPRVGRVLSRISKNIAGRHPDGKGVSQRHICGSQAASRSAWMHPGGRQGDARPPQQGFFRAPFQPPPFAVYARKPRAGSVYQPEHQPVDALLPIPGHPRAVSGPGHRFTIQRQQALPQRVDWRHVVAAVRQYDLLTHVGDLAEFGQVTHPAVVHVGGDRPVRGALHSIVRL